MHNTEIKIKENNYKKAYEKLKEENLDLKEKNRSLES